ncbi:MAG: HAMP domain-containing protein [Dehalococcoidales bacterium]|nr:HAMP domain-containing protein [Dehalococcoidales bacterium]
MTLRNKTLLVICLVCLCFVPIVHFVLWSVLSRNFGALESDIARQNIQRATNALNYNLISLGSLTNDWAAWDDTYVFVDDANNEYIKTNLVDGTFSELNLNLVMFINSAGQVIFSKAFDLQTNEETPIPEDLQDYFSPGSLLTSTNTNSNIDGIILLSKSPMFISSSPILTSEDKGPVRGTLVMGRYIDDTVLQQVAEVTQLSLTMERFNDVKMPADFKLALSSLSLDAPTFVQPLDKELIGSYALLQDIYGNPTLILRADMPRDIYKQGQTTFIYVALTLGILAVLCLAILVYFHRNTVLSSVIRLSNEVIRIGQSGDLSARISTSGRDELSSLADTINAMLMLIQKSESKLKNLYDEETQLRQKLETEIHNRVEFTRALVHELKTPLTPMLTSSDMITDELKEERLLRLAININRGAIRLNKRIDELLDLAKGEIGTLKLNLTEIDPSAFLHDVVEEITPLASQRKLSLELLIPSLLGSIRADEDRLRQVMINLLDNACKFTSRDGKIIIKAWESNGLLNIEVQDTGTGIAIEDQQKLFQPYYRSENNAGSGLGLGLALSKRLVELHGGQLWFTSRVGGGSTFGFSIPIRQTPHNPIIKS